MSAIDTIDHVHVGNFFDIPIYWFQDSCQMNSITDNEDDRSRSLDHTYLSIGGGSGEHPAMIINIEDVIYYIVELYNLDNYSEFYTDAIVLYCPKYDINLNHWDVETYMDISKAMTDNDKLFVHKLLLAMGLFVINTLPLDYCIDDQVILKTAHYLKHEGFLKSKEARDDYVGVTEVDYTLPLTSGRKLVDSYVVWGYTIKDWYKDHPNV